VKAVVHVRVPSWTVAEMPIAVNGQSVAVGKPGSYQAIERTWANGDTISFVLPMDFRVTPYAGADQIAGHHRYAVEYGPILLAAVGPLDANSAVTIAAKAADIKKWLKPKADRPLCFTIDGDPAHEFQPYWSIGDQAFCIFPIMQ